MIGFVEVDINHIKKAYSYIKKIENEKYANNDEKIRHKLNKINDIINMSAGKNKFFSKRERVRLKELLEDLVYSSYISSNDYIILRTELAGLIQDIIYLYEGNDSENRKTE